MGSYSSDKKNARFYGLKFSRTTDREIIERLDKQENIQQYIKNLIKNDMKEDKTMKKYTIKPEYLPLCGEDADENTIVTQDDVERFAADWEKPVDELMKQLDEAPTEKTITYLDREIELTSVLYRYGIGAEPQEGIYVHDTTDEFGDGDAIYGNGWKLEDIHDASDVESLIASGDFSTYITKNNDGTYTMDAENEETLWDGYDPENNHVFFVIDHLGHVWVCRQDGRELWNDEYYTEDGLPGLKLAILNEGYRLS